MSNKMPPITGYSVYWTDKEGGFDCMDKSTKAEADMYADLCSRWGYTDVGVVTLYDFIEPKVMNKRESLEPDPRFPVVTIPGNQH